MLGHRITLKWRSQLNVSLLRFAKLHSRAKVNPYAKVIIYTNFVFILVTQYIFKKDRAKERERDTER